MKLFLKFTLEILSKFTLLYFLKFLHEFLRSKLLTLRNSYESCFYLQFIQSIILKFLQQFPRKFFLGFLQKLFWVSIRSFFWNFFKEFILAFYLEIFRRSVQEFLQEIILGLKVLFLGYPQEFFLKFIHVCVRKLSISLNALKKYLSAGVHTGFSQSPFWKYSRTSFRKSPGARGNIFRSKTWMISRRNPSFNCFRNPKNSF